MSTTPTQTHPQYTWLFLAVRRADVLDRPHRHQVTAPTYDAARRLVARDYVVAFAGRLPSGRATL
ncbi:host cell division inhibitor Icd-like protein [Serratia ureilytica]|uniref:host cell division inhibitor Icd-like protein n=1 Tax=Serratia ureilytica TaxID=300181 RepID=UPI003717A867